MKNALIFIAMLIMFLILVVGIIATISHNFKNPIFTETDTSTFRTTTSTTTVHTTTSTSLTTTSTSTSSLTYITSSFSSTTICPQGIICSRSVNVIALYTPYVPLVIQTNPGYAAATGWGTCIKYNYQGVESPQICTGAKPEGDGSSVAEEMVPYNSIINYLCTAAWYPTPYAFVNWTGSVNTMTTSCNNANLLTVQNPVTIVANYKAAQTTTTITYYKNITLLLQEHGLPSGTRWYVNASYYPAGGPHYFNSTTNTITIAASGSNSFWIETSYIPGYAADYFYQVGPVEANTVYPIYYWPCGHGAPANVFNYTTCEKTEVPYFLVPLIFNYTSPLPQGGTWSMHVHNVSYSNGLYPENETFTTSSRYMIISMPPGEWQFYARKYNGTRTPPVNILVGTAPIVESGGFGGDYYVDAITPAKCSNGALYPPACNYFAASGDNSVQAEIALILDEISANVHSVFK